MSGHAGPIDDDDVGGVDGDSSIAMVSDVTDDGGELKVVEKIQGNREAIGDADTLSFGSDGLNERGTSFAPGMLDGSLVVMLVDGLVPGTVSVEGSLDGVLATATGLGNVEADDEEGNKEGSQHHSFPNRFTRVLGVCFVYIISHMHKGGELLFWVGAGPNLHISLVYSPSIIISLAR